MTIGPIQGYTANFSFTLVAYDFPRWQTYEHNNWVQLDAIMAALYGGAGIAGAWKNATYYNVNQRLVDTTNNYVYTCLVAHTTPATGTFAQERTANPTYWSNVNITPTNRGAWTTATNYNQYDYVQSGNQFAVCVIPHVSGTFATDVSAGKWNVLIDLSGYNPTACLVKANNLSDLTNAITARTNLGLGTAATVNTTALFQTANNLSEGNAVTIRANLGLGSAALQASGIFAQVGNNLSDITNKPNARSNLGLGTLAVQNNVDVSQISGTGAFGKTWLNTDTSANATKLLTAFVGDPGVSSPGTNGTIGLVPAPANGDAAASKYLSASGGWTTPTAAAARTSVRQTVQAGPQGSGVPTFLPGTSGTLTLVAQGVSTGVNALVVSAAQGSGAAGAIDFIYQFITNPQWTLSANITNYLFVNAQTGTTLTSSTAPIYQFGGAISTATNQFTFDIATMIGYLGNGSAAVATPLVCVGQATAGSSGATSTVAYAYNGIYDSGYTATLPAGSATPISVNHNIGVPDVLPTLRIKNTVSDLSYNPGDVVFRAHSQGASGYANEIPIWSTLLTAAFMVGAQVANSWNLYSRATGLEAALTRTSWSYAISARRNWGGA